MDQMTREMYLRIMQKWISDTAYGYFRRHTRVYTVPRRIYKSQSYDPFRTVLSQNWITKNVLWEYIDERLHNFELRTV